MLLLLAVSLPASAHTPQPRKPGAPSKPGDARSVYRLEPWREGFLIGTAAAGVGYMRYESGRHFPTDIIVGAAVGSALGWGIPALHRVADGRFAVAPFVDGRSVGLALRLDM